MLISEKRLAANRANALKPTGPRTPEGTPRSSNNALTHGVLAKAPTEQALMNKAVTGPWRALRAASLEAAAITHELQRQSESTANEDDTTRAMLPVRALNETSADRERVGAIPDLLPFREEKMNLNKPTHFDEAITELIAPTPISKPIYNPSKAA